MIFTCAGAAYSGQVANRAGSQAAQQGVGKLFCLAATAAGIPDKLERARKARLCIGIDGCEDHCCRKVMDKAGLPLNVHVVVTDLGIEKQPASPRLIMDTKKVVERIMQEIKG